MEMANSKQSCELGMIGLGVMGRNLLFNMAEKGFPVAGFDKDLNKVHSLLQESKDHKIYAAENINDFIKLLRNPRVIMMLVPAGAPVDSVIDELLAILQPGDLIIDAGNSYFKDTDVRSRKLSLKGIQFMGVGISGGEEGARHGPSIMPGGEEKSYTRVQSIFEAVAARVDNIPCVAYIGAGSAGHFVKMVHNGIEYAIMQLVSESYDLMKRGLQMNDDQLYEVFDDWNQGDLNSYLVEITGQIFKTVDVQTGKRLIDEILDVARQKGTGMWTSQSAMELQVPVPVIDVAVAMRDMSLFEKERDQANKILYRPIQLPGDNKETFLPHLRQALYTGMLITYAQGMALLKSASEKYKYHLNLDAISGVWLGGCIIRADMLKDIKEIFHKNQDLPNLLLDPDFSRKVMENQDHLRYIVSRASEMGLPIPALMLSLSYLDAYRSSWLPANLIQAQRDYFGAHTYERIDTKGTFHTDWQNQ
jgi:6-phosphogluconate dehydrogenase